MRSLIQIKKISGRQHPRQALAESRFARGKFRNIDILALRQTRMLRVSVGRQTPKAFGVGRTG